jgi:outer membrane protein TolC
MRNFVVAARSRITWWALCSLGLLGLLHPIAARGEATPAPPAPAAPAPAATAAPAAGEVLPLDQAVQLAQQHNRQVQNSARQVTANEHLLAATKTGRLPAFGVGFLGTYRLTSRSSQTNNQNENGTLPPIGPIPTVSEKDPGAGFVIASIHQKLLGLRTVNLNVKLQQTAVDTSREQVRLQEHDVRTSVKRVYYDLIETQSALAANEESIRYYRELERTVSDRVQQKTALQAELLDVQARRADQEHQTVVLRNAFQTSQEQLNYLMGRDVQTPFRIGTVADVTPPAQDQATLQTLALQQRPEVRQASLGVRSAQLNERLAREEYVPTLSVGLSYSYFTAGFSGTNDDVSVGLLFKWEPFDWGRRRETIRARQVAVQQQTTSLEDSRAQVIMDVNTQYRTVLSTRDALGVTQAVQEASRERVRLELDRYAQKTVLLSDALQAQSALALANTQNQEALSAYLTAVANLSRAIGEN